MSDIRSRLGEPNGEKTIEGRTVWVYWYIEANDPFWADMRALAGAMINSPRQADRKMANVIRIGDVLIPEPEEKMTVE
ncbi:MAG TPA: hypothetical protein VM123_02915 [archaeon]|nr:hypothetical protein [archaeon]